MLVARFPLPRRRAYSFTLEELGASYEETNCSGGARGVASAPVSPPHPGPRPRTETAARRALVALVFVRSRDDGLKRLRAALRLHYFTLAAKIQVRSCVRESHTTRKD